MTKVQGSTGYRQFEANLLEPTKLLLIDLALVVLALLPQLVLLSDEGGPLDELPADTALGRAIGVGPALAVGDSGVAVLPLEIQELLEVRLKVLRIILLLGG